MTSVANKLGMTAETLRSWVRRAQLDNGRRPGLTTDERQRMKELEREVKELQRSLIGRPRKALGYLTPLEKYAKPVASTG